MSSKPLSPGEASRLARGLVHRHYVNKTTKQAVDLLADLWGCSSHEAILTAVLVALAHEAVKTDNDAVLVAVQAWMAEGAETSGDRNGT